MYTQQISFYILNMNLPPTSLLNMMNKKKKKRINILILFFSRYQNRFPTATFRVLLRECKTVQSCSEAQTKSLLINKGWSMCFFSCQLVTMVTLPNIQCQRVQTNIVVINMNASMEYIEGCEESQRTCAPHTVITSTFRLWDS